MVKRKILFLSDDPRSNTGVGNVTKDIIYTTSHIYDFVVVGAKRIHHEHGRWIDLSDEVNAEMNISNANVQLLAHSGYGTQELVRQLIRDHKPDVLVHFTDPRQWIWLYEIANEIRQQIPIVYINIWDCYPPPYYNKPYYASCDTLMCISKQTYGLVHKVLGDLANEKLITYFPHGVDQNTFYKITPDSEEYSQIEKIKADMDCDFLVFWNSRNMTRKHPADVMEAFTKFADKVKETHGDVKVALLMHTEIVTEVGTDLERVRKDLYPNYNIKFSVNQLSDEQLNYLYNAADAVVCISSNEGWGLTCSEAIMTETHVVVNVTGGLQDQVGFIDQDGNYLHEDLYLDKNWHSNSNALFTEHGNWAQCCFPATKYLQGSAVTPYIYDELVSIDDVVKGLINIFDIFMLKDGTYESHGKEGRNYLLNNGLNISAQADMFISDIDQTIEEFIPQQRIQIKKI